MSKTVFVPPLATNLGDLKNRITTAVTSEDTFRGVWDKFDELNEFN